MEVGARAQRHLAPLRTLRTRPEQSGKAPSPRVAARVAAWAKFICSLCCWASCHRHHCPWSLCVLPPEGSRAIVLCSTHPNGLRACLENSGTRTQKICLSPVVPVGEINAECLGCEEKITRIRCVSVKEWRLGRNRSSFCQCSSRGASGAGTARRSHAGVLSKWTVTEQTPVPA